MKPMILDAAAKAGYQKQPNTNMYSSPNWYAHELGLYFYATGRTEPCDVRMSRGYKIRANGMIFEHIGKGDAGIQIFQRVQ
jgi:hypothetical protein